MPQSPLPIPTAQQPPSRAAFARQALWLPLLLALAASAALMAGGGDQWLADQLFQLQGQQWAAKNAWWSAHLVHKGGRNLSFLMTALVLLALIRSSLHPRWKPLRRPLGYLLLSVALSTGIIALLKSWTHMDCPWDLQRYGGLRPFIGLFEQRPVLLGHASCFPGGHSGSAYAWIAAYFFMLQVRPQWRRPALLIPLGIGVVFGFTQQLRGAHFLSHDLWSLAISWSVAVLLYTWMFSPSLATARVLRPATSTVGETA